MSESPIQQFKTAFTAFVGAPTQGNRDQLITSADAYRDAWIENKASGTPIDVSQIDDHVARPGRSLAASPTKYNERIRTEDCLVDDVPIRLILQKRISAHEGNSWWVISWRTRLGPGAPNRRFYKTRGMYWSIPAATALQLIDELSNKGGLDDDFKDERRYVARDIWSSDMNAGDKAVWLNAITSEDEDWGSNPFFVIAGDPNDQWRKVMIVDPDTSQATFRSITTSTTYKPRLTLREDSEWLLDNSMMDANVQQVRVFQSALKSVLGR